MFKGALSREEKRIRDEAQVALQIGFGFPRQQAKQMATEGVRQAINHCKKLGGYGIPPLGRKILELEHTGSMPSEFVRRLEMARQDGATDDDIVQFWSLSAVEQETTDMIHNALKHTACLSFVEQMSEKINPNDIDIDILMRKGAEMVRKSMPVFGDSHDTYVITDDDRRLPIELRHRVMNFTTKHGGDPKIKAESEKYSTYNAFVRAKIRAGEM